MNKIQKVEKKDDLANINVDWKESETKEYILYDLHKVQTQAKVNYSVKY